MAVSPAEGVDGEVSDPSRDISALRTRLRTAVLEPVGQFTAASNATLLVQLHRAGDDDLPQGVGFEDLDPSDLAVYKPRRGESPLWEFHTGTLHRREVAAFEISEALGWGLVPVTVLRDEGPFGVGSVQQFVAHDPERHYFWLLEHGDPDIQAQLRRMVLFDIIIDNADRKGSHVLLRRDDGHRIALIDHGVSLNVVRKLRTVAWDFAGQPVPADDRADIAALGDDLDAALGEVLDGLLEPAEREVLAARVTAAADLDAFPEPTGRYPFPWPPL